MCTITPYIKTEREEGTTYENANASTKSGQP